MWLVHSLPVVVVTGTSPVNLVDLGSCQDGEWCAEPGGRWSCLALPLQMCL